MPISKIIFTVLKKYEIIIASVLAIAVVVFLTFYLLLPNFSKAREIFSKQKILKEKLTALARKDQFLASVDYQTYKENLPKIMRAFGEEKDFVSLFFRLDELQSKTGVTILRADFQLGVVSTNSAALSKQSLKGAYVLPVTIEVAGDKEQVRNFIDSLTDLSGRLIVASTIQWQVKEGGLYQAKITGKTFFSPLPKTIGSIEAQPPALSAPQESVLAKIAKTLPQTKSEEEVSPAVGKKDLFSL